MTPTPAALDTMLEDTGSVVSAMVDWMSTTADALTAKPVLFLLCIGIPVAFLGVNLLRRIIRV